MESKELKALNNVYLEAVYGQSAGQELAKRRAKDDLFGAPNKKKKGVKEAVVQTYGTKGKFWIEIFEKYFCSKIKIFSSKIENFRKFQNFSSLFVCADSISAT